MPHIIIVVFLVISVIIAIASWLSLIKTSNDNIRVLALFSTILSMVLGAWFYDGYKQKIYDTKYCEDVFSVQTKNEYVKLFYIDGNNNLIDLTKRGYSVENASEWVVERKIRKNSTGIMWIVPIQYNLVKKDSLKIEKVGK